MRKLHTHEASPLDATGTIFTGAKIHTVDDSTVGAEAFLVFGNRFAAVGTLEECRTEARRLSTRTTAVVELDGATVVPGFVDPHAHPLMYGQMLSWVDCGPEKAHSIPGIIALLQEAALTAPAGVPIRGYGYEHRNLIEGRHPLKEELDQVATDREAYLMNASGHGGVVNSFTFDKHGIDASTENPAGGEFFRDEDGELTGELSDAACNILTGVNGVKVGHHGPNFHLEDEPEEHLRQLSVAQDKFLAGGVTTIGDCQVTRREFDMYLRLAEQDQLKTRVSMYMLSHLLDHVIDTGMHGAFGNSRLAFGGIKGKMEYEMLETRRFIAAHDLTDFRFNPHFPVNTLILMRGLVAARRAGVEAAYLEAMLKGMWEQGLKLDDPAVFVATADAAGLDGAALLAATGDPEVKAELVAGTEAVAARGAFGIPTLFVGDEMFFGKERLGQVEAELARA